MPKALSGALRVIAKALRLSRPRVAPDADFSARERESIDAEEKRYRQLADDPAALNMPFSDLSTVPVELYRFALVLAALDAGPRDEILDFGAGTCWISALLNRMGLKTVALDVSPTSLEIGRRSFDLDSRQRLDLEPEFHAYDGHRFPFEDGRFDAIVSFAAFHHVADQREVLGEMFRVAAQGARVVFCEPLLEHSESFTAQLETEAYGVFERDIDLKSFERQALEIGFDRLVLKPYSQTPDDELLSNSLLRNAIFSAEQAAKRYLDSYSVFYLQKGERPRDSNHPGLLRAALSAELEELTLPSAGEAELTVHLRNSGDTLWLSEPHPAGGHVVLGCQLLDADRRRIDRNHQRFPLRADIGPGESVDMKITLRAPDAPGRYVLKLVPVDEQVCWFDEVGSAALSIPLTVGPSSPR